MNRKAATLADTPELRRQAKKMIDRLSGLPLRFATDFLTYVQERQPDEATKELLEMPGFAESHARGVKDASAGRTKNWRKVRGDV